MFKQEIMSIHILILIIKLSSQFGYTFTQQLGPIHKERAQFIFQKCAQLLKIDEFLRTSKCIILLIFHFKYLTISHGFLKKSLRLLSFHEQYQMDAQAGHR